MTTSAVLPPHRMVIVFQALDRLRPEEAKFAIPKAVLLRNARTVGDAEQRPDREAARRFLSRYSRPEIIAECENAAPSLRRSAAVWANLVDGAQ